MAATLPFTLSEVRSRVRVLLDFKTSNYLTDAILNTLINLANIDVFKMLVNANTGHFVTTKSVTWPSGSESIDMTGSSYLEQVPYKILSIEETPESGVVSNSNKPVQWTPIRWAERTTWHHKYAVTNVYSYRSTGYVPMGDLLYAAPVPASARYLKVAWISPLEELSGDSDTVLTTTVDASSPVPTNGDAAGSGTAPSFSDAVVYRACYLANIKQDGDNPTIHQLWAEAAQGIEKYARTRQVQGPRFVHARRGG